MIFFDSFSHPLVRETGMLCIDRDEAVVDLSSVGGLKNAVAIHGPPRALVMGPPSRCEAQELRAACADPAKGMAYGQSIGEDALGFLSNCRLATQAMITQGQGRVVFLGIDDVAARIVGLPETPMANQLRVSGLKSLAKEYGRMGIQYNAILSQPSKETVETAVWRKRRDALKVYAMRFSPNGLKEYAEFCVNAIIGPLPLNGGVVCLGNGVMELTP